MSITKMNVLDIMAESMKTSVVNTDNVSVEEMASEVASEIQDIEEMNIEFRYTPEMVPVIFDEATGNYYVEYDMLKKLHEEAEEEEAICVTNKYGKITFTPNVASADVSEPGDEAITEEEPEEDEPTEDEDENTIEESYGCFAPSVVGGCWERDALAAVIRANIPEDPNKSAMGFDEEDPMPEMTMENTYIVIESETELINYIYQVSEAAKSGGIAMKHGKAKLKKADQVFKNLKNAGLKVIKKSKKSKKK